jgi:Glycosyl transferase 4-like
MSTLFHDDDVARHDQAGVGSVRRQVLIIVENLPVPFDARVWPEASTLARHRYEVSVICPKGPGATASFEIIEGVAVYRHWLPEEGRGVLGNLAEYSAALFWEFVLKAKSRTPNNRQARSNSDFRANQSCFP